MPVTICTRCKGGKYPIPQGTKTCDSCRLSKARYQKTLVGRQKYNASKTKWRKSDHGRELVYAHAYVGTAVKQGKLVKQPCELCGETKVEAHHDDYSPEKRLDVRWLCIPHHRQHHKELKNVPVG